MTEAGEYLKFFYLLNYEVIAVANTGLGLNCVICVLEWYAYVQPSVHLRGR